MKSFLRAIVIGLMLATGAVSVQPVAAQTMSLADAQAQGLVGERLDGYVGIVKSAPGVQTLVDDINLKRRQLYRDVARKNDIPLETVEKLAGKKAIERASSGIIVQDASGNWVQKP